MAHDLPEEDDKLWVLAAAPLVWAAHLLVSYATVAVYCAKVAGKDGSLGPARVAVAALTAVALASIVWVGVRGYRRYARGLSRDRRDADTRLGRHRFLGFATMLLSGLSFISVVFEALPIAFFGSCV